MNQSRFLAEHFEITRRFFLKAGVIGVAALNVASGVADETAKPAPKKRAKPDKGGVRPDPYFTPSEDFKDVSWEATAASLPDEKKAEVGLTRESWRLEVISDPEHPAKIGKPLTKVDGTALDFEALLKLGETHAVRFAKVMTCLNLGCPLGMGLWKACRCEKSSGADRNLVHICGESSITITTMIQLRCSQFAANRASPRRSVRSAACDSVLQTER